jgi:cytochrome P450
MKVRVSLTMPERRRSKVVVIAEPSQEIASCIRNQKEKRMVDTTPVRAALAPRRYAPISGIDPYCDEALLNPWDTYRQLQDIGPVVWLTRYKMFALTRYDSVRRALQDQVRSRLHLA